MHRACWRGHGHHDAHAVALALRAVHKPQVHDIHPDLRIVDLPQHSQDVFVFDHVSYPTCVLSSQSFPTLLDKHSA